MKDMVNKPHHYIGEYGLEAEIVLENFICRYGNGYIGHRISSAIEYLLRAPEKNEIEDIRKAHRNLGQVLDYIEAKGVETLK